MVSKKIFPTITTNNVHEYRQQMETIYKYASGVHLDFSDGVFAPTRLLPIDRAWRIDGFRTHVHLMQQKPIESVDDIITLLPDLVILHAESDNVLEALIKIRVARIRCGIALLPETDVDYLASLKADKLFDHILVFAGNLGYQGAESDLEQVKKVKRLVELYPDIELSWDGGINAENIKEISDSGIDVLNVGGYLHKSKHPKKSYDNLLNLVS